MNLNPLTYVLSPCPAFARESSVFRQWYQQEAHVAQPDAPVFYLHQPKRVDRDKKSSTYRMDIEVLPHAAGSTMQQQFCQEARYWDYPEKTELLPKRGHILQKSPDAPQGNRWQYIYRDPGFYAFLLYFAYLPEHATVFMDSPATHLALHEQEGLAHLLAEQIRDNTIANVRIGLGADAYEMLWKTYTYMCRHALGTTPDFADDRTDMALPAEKVGFFISSDKGCETATDIPIARLVDANARGEKYIAIPTAAIKRSSLDTLYHETLLLDLDTSDMPMTHIPGACEKPVGMSLETFKAFLGVRE